MTDIVVKRKQARTGFYIQEWGVPKEIHICDPIADNELAVFEFLPCRGRKSWRYATNGMSEYIQKYEEYLFRTELYALTNNQAPFAVKLLSSMARYPFSNQTYFSEFDTIPLGHSIGQKNLKYTALLLAPPCPEDGAQFNQIPDVTKEPIYIYFVAPLFATELEFAINKGGKNLWEILLNSGFSLALDAKRKAVV